jgi:hypothetical protein
MWSRLSELADESPMFYRLRSLGPRHGFIFTCKALDNFCILLVIIVVIFMSPVSHLVLLYLYLSAFTIAVVLNCRTL